MQCRRFVILFQAIVIPEAGKQLKGCGKRSCHTDLEDAGGSMTAGNPRIRQLNDKDRQKALDHYEIRVLRTIKVADEAICRRENEALYARSLQKFGCCQQYCRFVCLDKERGKPGSVEDGEVGKDASQEGRKHHAEPQGFFGTFG